MMFKGLSLETGDFVAFRGGGCPLPEVQAAVIDVSGGTLEVMSTFLVPFQHGGKFTEDEIDEILLVYPAAVAIPQESRGRRFAKHQMVSTITREGEKCEGQVVAAFDGLVVIRDTSGRLITGGVSHFNA